MFYYLQGTITVIEENLAVVDCGGVGYACHTTGYTLSQLRMGQSARLFTYFSIRENAVDLFGFAGKEELDCFEKLLSVSGVGPKAALAILSAVTPERFALSVMTGDEKALMAAQGVGKKLAQRIILELKDKLGTTELPTAAAEMPGATAHAGGKLGEATAALASLGYSHAEIGAALKGIDLESNSLEQIVRLALRAMVMK